MADEITISSAEVVGYERTREQVRALLVVLPTGQQVKVRSGFTLGQRRNPPPVGSLVNVGWAQTTKGGRPRSVSFVGPCLRKVG